MASQPQTTGWLVKHGLRNWNCCSGRRIPAFRAHPAGRYDRRYRDASIGAGQFLGLPRDKIIGRSVMISRSPSSSR